MPRIFRSATRLLPLLLVLGVPAAAPSPEPIAPNDNRRAAGRLEGGVLTLRLEARLGEWQPDGTGGPRIATAAFAEAGRPLETPGPLIRVPAGTEVRVTVRNRLAHPLWLHGMGAARGLRADSVAIAPGAEREVRFRAAEPGTYYYAARTTARSFAERSDGDSQLGGVIVVDPAGATRPPADRIFAITEWFTLDSTTVSGLGPNATLAINGRSWPETERIDATVGDSLDWRVVNLTGLAHPMHLHGFYFRVDAKGDGARDTVYAPDARRLAVTELLSPGRTMAIRWSPERSGNWIFHCHFASHLATRAALEADRRMPPALAAALAAPAARPPLAQQAGHGAAGHDPMQHNMSALVIGIRVAPRAAAPMAVASERAARPIRLLIRSRASVYGEYAGYSYVLGGSPEEADSTAMPVPGPLLELRRGEPVAVTIVNRSHEPAAVHWHGIELESFPDGVPGWSGEGAKTLPMVAPRDSLTVRFTPPRAGTFIYHSHSNEFQQIGSGLYGALLVVDSAAPRDPESDRVLLFSDAGPTVNFLRPPPPAFLNGSTAPAPIELRAGRATRLRLINIRTDYLVEVALLAGDRPAEWRILAKDGADRPAAAARPAPALLVLAPGETYDVEVTPAAGAELALRYRMPGTPPPGAPPAPVTTVEVRVR